MVAATPSGITLAPEGGAHQSIATPLIGMAQDGLISFEPAFVDELAVIMGFGFEHMQREAGEGGSLYLRLSTRTIEQPQRLLDGARRQSQIDRTALARLALHVLEAKTHDDREFVDKGRLEGNKPVLRHADQGRCDRLVRAALGRERDP